MVCPFLAVCTLVDTLFKLLLARVIVKRHTYIVGQAIKNSFRCELIAAGASVDDVSELGIRMSDNMEFKSNLVNIVQDGDRQPDDKILLDTDLESANAKQIVLNPLTEDLILRSSNHQPPPPPPPQPLLEHNLEGDETANLEDTNRDSSDDGDVVADLEDLKGDIRNILQSFHADQDSADFCTTGLEISVEEEKLRNRETEKGVDSESVERCDEVKIDEGKDMSIEKYEEGERENLNETVFLKISKCSDDQHLNSIMTKTDEQSTNCHPEDTLITVQLLSAQLFESIKAFLDASTLIGCFYPVCVVVCIFWAFILFDMVGDLYGEYQGGIAAIIAVSLFTIPISFRVIRSVSFGFARYFNRNSSYVMNDPEIPSTLNSDFDS
jgi:hypothetical protein